MVIENQDRFINELSADGVHCAMRAFEISKIDFVARFFEFYRALDDLGDLIIC
jgi:hypothetical protein